MKVSFRAMGSAVEYFMFSKWKSKILVCLCIFYKNFGVKIKDTILFINHFDLGLTENSLKTEIPWCFLGKQLRFQRNRGRPKTITL